MRLTKLFECWWKKCGWLTIPAETGEGCGPAQGHLLSHTNVKGSSKSPEPEQTEMSPLSWCSTCNRVFLFLPGLPDLYLYFGNPSLICCFTYPSITNHLESHFCSCWHLARDAASPHSLLVFARCSGTQRALQARRESLRTCFPHTSAFGSNTSAAPACWLIPGFPTPAAPVFTLKAQSAWLC